MLCSGGLGWLECWLACTVGLEMPEGDGPICVVAGTFPSSC